MIFIANDGNLMPSPVVLSQLDEQGIAERYDIVIDFSRYNIGDKVWMVNLCEHQNGKKPSKRPHDCSRPCRDSPLIPVSANSWSSASFATLLRPT